MNAADFSDLAQEEKRPLFTAPLHGYEVRPRSDHRGVDLISDALPFGRLWFGEPNAVGNANRICGALPSLTRCCDSCFGYAGNLIETHEHAGEFKEW